MSVTPVNLGKANIANASSEQRKAILRQAVDEVVGVTFFGQMLKMARNSVIKGEYGHGGRGEEVFGAQLDMELARRVGGAMPTSLSETIYRRLAKRV